jgi:hypothetical protein
LSQAGGAGADPTFLAACALFLAVLIADAVLIALAAPDIVEIGSLYSTTT